MKVFFKNILSSMLGMFLFFIVGFIFLVTIFIISISIWNKSPLDKIKQGSLLEICFNEKIIENPTEINSDFLDWKNYSKICLKDQIDAIYRAKNDTLIRGISLKINVVDIGITQIKEFHNALKDFKKSGKFVYAYLNDVTQKGYYLSSISDKIFLNPTGTIEFFGLSSEVLFFKNFGDKYGIKFNVIRHGEYKSAVEPFFRNSISKENRLQISENLTDLWNYISKEIANYRKIHIDMLNKVVSELSSIIPELALKNKLVDEIIQEIDYDTILKKKLKLSKVEDINIISLNEYHEKTLELSPSKNNNKIAILYFSGLIMPGNEISNIQSEFYKEIIREIKNDISIKGLVIRINSPGGSANTSDEILHELKLLKEKKPITVSFGDIAASGGYYIAMQADSIFAYPTTITGSIGVLGMIPDAKKLINNLGITSELIQTHPNSYFYSPTYGLSKGGEQILIQSVQNIYNRFVNIVAKNRKKSFKEIDSIAQGRIWSGERALKNGLIDQFGSLQRAINSVSKLAKLNFWRVESYPKVKNSFHLFFKNFIKKNYLDKELKQFLSKDEYFFLKKINQIKNESGIMMISPMEIKF